MRDLALRKQQAGLDGDVSDRVVVVGLPIRYEFGVEAERLGTWRKRRRSRTTGDARGVDNRVNDGEKKSDNIQEGEKKNQVGGAC